MNKSKINILESYGDITRSSWDTSFPFAINSNEGFIYGARPESFIPSDSAKIDFLYIAVKYAMFVEVEYAQ